MKVVLVVVKQNLMHRHSVIVTLFKALSVVTLCICIVNVTLRVGGYMVQGGIWYRVVYGIGWYMV